MMTNMRKLTLKTGACICLGLHCEEYIFSMDNANGYRSITDRSMPMPVSL